MNFLAVILVCQTVEVSSCIVINHKYLLPNLGECQIYVNKKVDNVAARGLIGFGYCAPVDTGMSI
jgi:hypothetical protein